MDPVTLVTLSTPAIKMLSALLTKRSKLPLAAEAHAILQADTTSQSRVRNLFEAAKNRLRSTWTIGMFMTVALFVLFVGMALAAVVTGIITGKSTYSIVFGGVSAVSLFTVILWKPYDKAFQAAITTQRLEMILVGLEEEWVSCGKVDDPQQQAQCIRAANKAALAEMAKIK